MNINDVIAQNVRAARERKKLTLDGAAELTGVSRSMLAQIEKGRSTPPSLWCGKSPTASRSPSPPWWSPRARGVRPPVRRASGGGRGRYRNYPAFPFDERRLFETYRIVIEPQGHLEAQPHMRGTEEYITVFQGTAEIGAGRRSTA